MHAHGVSRPQVESGVGFFMSSGPPLELWLDCRQVSPRPSIGSGLFDRGVLSSEKGLFDRVILSSGEGTIDPEATPAGVELESLVIRRPPGVDVDALISASTGAVLGASVSCESPDDQQRALALVGSVEWVHLDSGASNVFIASENLLAAADATPTRIAVGVSDASAVPGLAFALGRGVDALVCALDRMQPAMVEALQIAKSQRLEHSVQAPQDDAAKVPAGPRLGEATVTAVHGGGVADRVALDFTRLLAHDEGCLVGSSSMALAFVHGETVASGFVPPRPFRCNAGPVHSYILMADGSKKYLSEVRTGDEVFVAQLGGDAMGSSAVVGRCKVEPRPTLRVEFSEHPGSPRMGSVFLQQAETVRLGTGGKPELPTTPGLAVTRVTAGSRILVAWGQHGTHVGRTIAVKVDEY